MKRTDIAMIILIASASALIAYFITNAIFGSVTNDSVKVKTIDKINATFEAPDPEIFNENAINPTVEAQIPTTQTTTDTSDDTPDTTSQ